MPAAAAKKKQLTLVPVRFGQEEKWLFRLLQARAEANDRSLSGQLKHYAASTPSGMAPAASVVMTLPASRSGRPEPVRFIERPTHGVKQLRPSHVSATVQLGGVLEIRDLTSDD